MSIVHMLRQETSTVTKQSLLKRFCTDMWKKSFLYCYHPDMMYGIKGISVDHHELGEPNEEMFTLLDAILSNQLRGNAAKDAVKDFMDLHGCLIAHICRKDMSCGVTATTLNKVFGADFIPQFKVQKADEVPFEKVRFPVEAQLKYDGVRVLAFVRNGKVTLKTRNGNTFDFPDLQRQLLRITDCVLDGELIAGDGSLKHRTNVSGLVNSAIHGTPIKDTKKELTFAIFDTMSLNEFDSLSCKADYEDRLDLVKMRVCVLKSQAAAMGIRDLVIMSTGITLNNIEELVEHSESMYEKGFEGLILKRLDHLYTFKRSKDWVKVKQTKEVTLNCIGAEFGEAGTKYANCIGALVCEGFAENVKVKVNVGSGLSDTQRNMPKAMYLGKVDIKYNSIVQDKKTGEYSLFLPRFKTCRKDL